MGFKKFSWLIVIRTILTMTTLVLLTQVISFDGYHITTLVLLFALFGQLAELISFVSKTNAELVRFFAAARYADFSQRFELKKVGSGFDEMGKAFNDILLRIQLNRNEQQQEIKHLKALIEHIPVPLISIDQADKVTLWNNSARRLFGSHAVTKVDDLLPFGQYFPQQLKTLPAGKRDLVNIVIDEQEHQLSIAATQVISSSSKETLISLQDIQTELDRAQLQAWQDLVRVLTHEIMNSITPITSLAKTATDIVEEVKNNQGIPEPVRDELDDIAQAVATVARRSEGLMKFVASYRRLTRLPQPNKENIALVDLIGQVEALVTQEWSNKHITLTVNIVPKTLDFAVDAHMIEQVLINLLRNAEQALEHQANAVVTISAFINLRGRVAIEVSNNGPAIPKEIAAQVFVPFFTTKTQGSGVGLALSRQIMLAHQGNILLRCPESNTAQNSTESSNTEQNNRGVVFSLTF